MDRRRKIGGAPEFDASSEEDEVWSKSPKTCVSKTSPWRPGSTTESREWAPVFGKSAEKDSGYAPYPSGEASNVPEGFIAEHELVPNVDASEGMPVGAWTHIALTYDGKTCASTSMAARSSKRPKKSKPAKARCGSAACPTAPTEFFHGKIDEARVYDRTLSRERSKRTSRPRWRHRRTGRRRRIQRRSPEG